MTRIRHLHAHDLPQVVSLYRTHLARPHIASHDELVASFERIFLDAPLQDPEIPSLVAENGDGQVVGFLGSQVHRMRFDGRDMRLACSSALVVAPQARKGGTGARMLRRYLAGPQDLTITDTAARATEYMWKLLGGSLQPLNSIVWVHPLRPLHAVVGLGLWRFNRHGWLPLLRPLCRPLDLLLTGRSASDDRSGAQALTEEPLSPELMIGHLRLGREGTRLWPDPDACSLGRLVEEIGRSRAKGTLIKGLVRGREGEPVGWYVANLLPNDIFEIMHLAAAHGKEDLLYSYVLDKARKLKAAALRGRLEPWLVEVLPRRALMFSRVRFLFHTRHDAVREAVRCGDALLTGLEGDMWMPS